MSDFVAKKDVEIDSDDEEELEEQRKAEADAAPKADEPEEDTSLANSDVTTKYLEAAKITQAALIEVASLVGLPANLLTTEHNGSLFSLQCSSL
jgi:hypothetical protein